MSDDPELNALADQARLALSPDERATLVASVQDAVAACAVLASEPFGAPGEAPDDAALEAATDTADDADGVRDGSDAPQQSDDEPAEPITPGPPAAVGDDVIALCDDARERFTALSPAAREGFFVVPRVPHGQGH